MAINRKAIILALFFLGLSGSLASWESVSEEFEITLDVSQYFDDHRPPGYFVSVESGQQRLYQRLTWSGGENALRYEVIIQRIEDEAYHVHLREFSVSHYIIVSLPPGEYRFQVIPYDVLNRPSEGSEWMYIEVLPAVKPELHETQITVDFFDTSNYVLDVSGRNIDYDAEISIRHPDGNLIVPQIIEPRDSNNVQLLMDSDFLSPGEYKIIIRNPGGLEASIGGIVLVESPHVPLVETVIVYEEESLKTLLLSAGLSWNPLFLIYGEGFDNSYSLAGTAIHANAAFLTPLNMYIGIELFAAFDNLDQNNLLIGVNLLVLKRLFKERASIGLRFGAAYPVIDFHIEHIIPGVGVSFGWLFDRRFLLEAGVNYRHMYGGFLNGFAGPWIGFSYMF
jgi:hypothetical protein